MTCVAVLRYNHDVSMVFRDSLATPTRQGQGPGTFLFQFLAFPHIMIIVSLSLGLLGTGITDKYRYHLSAEQVSFKAHLSGLGLG